MEVSSAFYNNQVRLYNNSAPEFFSIFAPEFFSIFAPNSLKFQFAAPLFKPTIRLNMYKQHITPSNLIIQQEEQEQQEQRNLT